MSTANNTARRPFMKMHGLGNDFIVFDARHDGLQLTSDDVRHLADRRLGIGCDQLITLLPSATSDAFMRIHNHDGEESGACGNASRCIGAYLMKELGKDTASIDTLSGVIACEAGPNGDVIVDMGEPSFDWQAIPLAEPRDTLDMSLEFGRLNHPSAVSMGNPHVVFFVDNPDTVNLAALGPLIERYPLFPERTNVNVAEIISDTRLRMRVWERGVGETSACGTGACATAVSAARRNLTGRRVDVELKGGVLTVEWRADNRIILSGPVSTSFRGETEIPSLRAGVKAA